MEDEFHARYFSLGGGVLTGLALAFAALTFFAFSIPSRAESFGLLFLAILAALILYAVDAWSESLLLTDETLIFDSWLKRERRFALSVMESVLLVHEGLNVEIGIETLTIRRAQGDERRLALGPLWRRRDLEAFLHELEKRIGKKKLVDEVR